MGHSKYDDDTKAAVMAALLEGQSIRSVAEEYDIPRGTVGGWARKAKKQGVSNVSDTKKAEIGDLLIKYLSQNLQALQTQAKQFADEEWLCKQNAAEVATLHGVMTDKAVRLLKALNANDESDAG